MINPDFIAQLGKQIVELLPAPVKTTHQELERNVRALIQASFAKLDLVTRDEFDAQVALLRRTQTKLDNLQKELEGLRQMESSIKTEE